MENFKKLVREKVKNEKKEKIVIDYFYRHFNEKENVLIYLFNNISKFDDIFNEFIECLEKNTYSFFNCVFVGSYNAKMIATLDKNFTPYDVYYYLTGLKDNDEPIRLMLEAHIAMKLLENDLENE